MRTVRKTPTNSSGIILLRPPTKKGIINKHYIARLDRDGREYRLDATKGWRSRRA